MDTTEIFSILAYCSRTAHGASAASWNRFSINKLQLHRRSHRRMVFMVSMYNSQHFSAYPRLSFTSRRFYDHMSTEKHFTFPFTCIFLHQQRGFWDLFTKIRSHEHQHNTLV